MTQNDDSFRELLQSFTDAQLTSLHVTTKRSLWLIHKELDRREDAAMVRNYVA
jgi:hypothetical protein